MGFLFEEDSCTLCMINMPAVFNFNHEHVSIVKTLDNKLLFVATDIGENWDTQTLWMGYLVMWMGRI